MSIEKPVVHAQEEEKNPQTESWNKTVAEAVQKRAAFNEALTAATTVDEVKKALEDVAVFDEFWGKKIVVNFFEGALAGTNETDAFAGLDEITAGVDAAAAAENHDFNAITEHVWNYAAASALERILNAT